MKHFTIIPILLLTLSTLSFSQIDILENGNIGIGKLNPQYKIQLDGPVHTTGTFVIGTGSNANLKVRHISGKSHVSNSYAPLYLNWYSKQNVYVGQQGTGSLIVADQLKIGPDTQYLFGDDVGFFTATPEFKVDIRKFGKNPFRIGAGDGRDYTIDIASGTGLMNMVAGARRNATGYEFTGYRGSSKIRLHDSHFIFSVSKNSGSEQVAGNQVNYLDVLFLTRSGEDSPRVGIGSLVPNQTLSVNGDASKQGGGEWLVFSDKRLKKDIKEFTSGLKEVLLINPITFKYNGKAGIKEDNKEYVGVLAQEIAKIAPFTVEKVNHKTRIESRDVKGNLKSSLKDGGEYLQFDGNAIKYMLINAIQEQQEMILGLKAEINDLREDLSETSQINTIDIALTYSNDNKPALFQNRPNPTSGNTVIGYYLPETVNSSSISFYAVDGSLIYQERLESKGYNEIQLNTDRLSNGMFYYSLEVDNQKVDQKSFVVSK